MMARLSPPSSVAVSMSRFILYLVLVATLPTLVLCNIQETLIGIAGKDFVVFGADTSIASSGGIAWTASSLDKIHVFNHNIIAASVGDAADSDRLLALLQAHCKLRLFEASNNINDIDGDLATSSRGLPVSAVAHLARQEIWESLRSSQRKNVGMLIAGMVPADTNTDDGMALLELNAQRIQQQIQRATLGNNVLPHNSQQEPFGTPTTTRLYWIDPYGAQQDIRYGAHGFASNFCLSILDQQYRPSITKEEAVDLLRTCFDQLKERYIINSPQPPCIKCLDASGTERIQ